jgi:hypothetical protein
LLGPSSSDQRIWPAEFYAGQGLARRAQTALPLRIWKPVSQKPPERFFVNMVPMRQSLQEHPDAALLAAEAHFKTHDEYFSKDIIHLFFLSK